MGAGGEGEAGGLEACSGGLAASEYALPAGLEARLLSPALVVHLAKVRANVRRVIASLGGDASRWRPHLKTTKLPAVWRVLLEEGVRNFKVATTREAAVLLATLRDAGIRDADVLLAYPLVGPNLSRLAELAERHAGAAAVSVLAEDAEGAAAVPANLGVFADVNVGMNRSGVPLERALEAVAGVAGACGEGRFRGVSAYEGHLHAPGEERVRQAHAVYDSLVELVRRLREEHGVTVGELVTSGTPALAASLSYPWGEHGIAHKASAGTVVLHDVAGAIQNPGCGLVPAAVLFTRCVSLPGDGRCTLDAGSKSLATDAGDPVAAVVGHGGMTLQKVSEEHAPVVLSGGEPQPRRGDVFWLVPKHVCPTVNLAERAVVLDEQGGFSVEEVAGRAHDVLVDDPHKLH